MECRLWMVGGEEAGGRVHHISKVKKYIMTTK